MSTYREHTENSEVQVEVISVDVGNGDCTLVLFKDAEDEIIYSILIDAGYGGFSY